MGIWYRLDNLISRLEYILSSPNLLQFMRNHPNKEMQENWIPDSYTNQSNLYKIRVFGVCFVQSVRKAIVTKLQT